MNKLYEVFLGNKKIGSTRLENADAPMGVVSGKIIPENISIDYNFIKTFCTENKIELTADYLEDKLIVTRTIENMKIINGDVEIKGLGNQIEGNDEEGYIVSIEGISYPFYEQEFPHHVKDYEERF